jgi:aryl-alcohol dehydrogenase-like predicted oxidoreductase
MGFTHAYGTAMDDTEAEKVIAEAVEMGYTFFDTAECYTGTRADGSLAFNEDIVGRALAPYRNRIVLASKCGVAHGANGLITDSRPETIRKSLEESLRRLKTDHLDLYYQHRIDPNVPAEEVAGVMGELIHEGKILHWGISETDEKYLRRAHKVCPVTCIQNRYSMMARWFESLFPVLEELHIGYVAFSPLANGFLTGTAQKGTSYEKGDYRGFMPQFTDEAIDANKELLELLSNIANEKHATQAQISLAWMLNKKPYIVPIPGSRKMARIKENFDAAKITLTADQVAEIDKKLDSITTSDVFGGSAIRK